MKKLAEEQPTFPEGENRRRGLKTLSLRMSFTFYLVVIAFVLTFIGFFLFHREYQRIQLAQSRELASIGAMKARTIERWAAEFMENTARVAQYGLDVCMLQEFLNRPEDPDILNQISQRLGHYVQHGDTDEAALYSLSGELLVAAAGQIRESPAGLCEGAREVGGEALVLRKPVLHDLYRRPDGSYGVDVIVPLGDDVGDPYALLVMSKDPERDLYPLLKEWPVSSETAESFIVRIEADEFVILSPRRFNPERPLKIRYSVESLQRFSRRENRGPDTSFYIGKDHDGKKVGADFRPLRGLPWFLISKISSAEALREARINGIIIAGGGFVFFLLAGSVLALLLLRNRKDYYRELYQRERSMAELHREYIATLFGIGEGVISADLEGRVKWLNAAAERLTGWSETEARGQPLTEVFPIRDEKTGIRMPCQASVVVKKGKRIASPVGRILSSRDGKERAIMGSGSPIRDSQGRIRGVVIIFQDISEQRREEFRNRMLSTIVERSMNEIFIYDAETLRYTYANRSTTQNLGYSLKELMRMTPLDLKPEISEEDFAAVLNPLRSGKALTVNFVTTHRRKDGSFYDIFLSTEPFDGPDGKSFISFGLDYTERRKLEKDLQKSLLERETLLKELHHRTKNNLQVVASLLSLEKARMEEEKSLQSSLGDMEKRVGAMALVHERLYQSESLSFLELRPYLDSVLGFSLTAYNAGPRIRHRLEVPRIEVSVEVASPLGLLVTELATNSAKHGYPDGGRGEVLLVLERDGEEGLKLRYRDDGVGLSPDYDPVEGEHLGMTLVRDLAEHQLQGRYSQGEGPGFSCFITMKIPHGARIREMR